MFYFGKIIEQVFYCDKIRTYVLLLIFCILDKAENIRQYIGVGSDGSHDPPILEIDMKMLLLAIVVMVATTIATSPAQAFCGDSCVEGQHVMRDSYGNEIRLRNGEWVTYPSLVVDGFSRRYQPAYKEMGEGES